VHVVFGTERLTTPIKRPAHLKLSSSPSRLKKVRVFDYDGPSNDDAHGAGARLAFSLREHSCSGERPRENAVAECGSVRKTVTRQGAAKWPRISRMNADRKESC